MPAERSVTIAGHRLSIVRNALNEILNGIELFEFETRIGAPRDEVSGLLAEIPEASSQGSDSRMSAPDCAPRTGAAEMSYAEFVRLVGALIHRLTIQGRDAYGGAEAEPRLRAVNEAVHCLAGMLARSDAKVRVDEDLREFLVAAIEPLSPTLRTEALRLIDRAAEPAISHD